MCVPGGRSRVQALVQPLSLCRGFGAGSWVSSLGSWGAGASLGPRTDVHPHAPSPRNQRTRGPRPGINTPVPPPQPLGREGLGMWEPHYHPHSGNRPALAGGLGERSGTDPLTRVFLRPLH